jgi:dimethylargininase
MKALVRPVPASYDRCLRSNPVPIDVARARRQHQAYVEALRACGREVVVLETLDDMPDSVFVEDPVVVLDRFAVLTRPGAPSRRGEGATMLGALGAYEVERMEAPAQLDGGDVLRIGARLFVGMSDRTNREGFAFLEAVARRDGIEAVPVPVRRGLHLESVCTRLGEGVIGLFDRVDRDVFESRGIETLDAPEEMGANVLDLGSRVIVSAAAPRTAEIAGDRALIVDVGELHKGDGGLTCLSVHLER